MCITMNPRHATYYERCLIFKPLGELKAYPSVLDNPALAKRVDLSTAREECAKKGPRLLEQFFSNRTPLDVLQSGYRMTLEDLQYFFVELTSTFADTPPETLDCLRQHYPQGPWESWLVPSQPGQ